MCRRGTGACLVPCDRVPACLGKDFRSAYRPGPGLPSACPDRSCGAWWLCWRLINSLRDCPGQWRAQTRRRSIPDQRAPQHLGGVFVAFLDQGRNDRDGFQMQTACGKPISLAVDFVRTLPRGHACTFYRAGPELPDAGKVPVRLARGRTASIERQAWQGTCGMTSDTIPAAKIRHHDRRAPRRPVPPPSARDRPRETRRRGPAPLPAFRPSRVPRLVHDGLVDGMHIALPRILGQPAEWPKNASSAAWPRSWSPTSSATRASWRRTRRARWPR